MQPTKKLNEYDQQAADFLESTGTKFEAVFLGTMPHFQGETEKRDIYQMTLTNSREFYSFRFGDSIINTYRHALKTNQNVPDQGQLFQTLMPYARKLSLNDYSRALRKEAKKWEKPTAYSALTCLTSYNPGTFADFCDNYGYDEDSRQAFRTFEAVTDEFSGISKIFSSEQLEQLQEIN